MTTATENAYHHNAASAYRASSYHGMSERETMAVAMRVLVQNMHLAADAYRVRRLDIMCDYNGRSLRILALLRDQLLGGGACEDADAGAVALRLSDLYAHIFGRLVNVLRAEDVDAEYEALNALLKPLYYAWRGEISNEPSTEVVGREGFEPSR